MPKLLKYMSSVLLAGEVPGEDKDAITEMMILYDLVRRLQESDTDCELCIDCKQVAVTGIVKVYQPERRGYMNYSFASLPDLRLLIDTLTKKP